MCYNKFITLQKGRMLMEEKVMLLESEIDAEILNFIINEEIQNRNLKIIIDSEPISCEEKSIICKHLNEFWLKELEEEGFISASKDYHFSIKSYSETKYLIQLKFSHFSWIIKRLSL